MNAVSPSFLRPIKSPRPPPRFPSNPNASRAPRPENFLAGATPFRRCTSCFPVSSDLLNTPRCSLLLPSVVAHLLIPSLLVFEPWSDGRNLDAGELRGDHGASLLQASSTNAVIPSTFPATRRHPPKPRRAQRSSGDVFINSGERLPPPRTISGNLSVRTLYSFYLLRNVI